MMQEEALAVEYILKLEELMSNLQGPAELKKEMSANLSDLRIGFFLLCNNTESGDVMKN